MLKIITLLICLSASFQFPCSAAENTIQGTNIETIAVKSIPCARQLQSCLDKILQLPEAKRLISSIQQEGNIRVIVNNDHYLSRQFDAFWDPHYRTITVNYSSHPDEGSLIGSIVFELHNASMNSQLKHLNYLAETGRIDREAYIEGMEKIEYQNSLNASYLTYQGIQRGIFPKSAFLPTYATFEEHYRIQKKGGHSAYIGHNYDSIASTPRWFHQRSSARSSGKTVKS